jgi:uncharacterized protein (TIGR03437 family)
VKAFLALAVAALLIPNLRAQTPTFANLDYVGKGDPSQTLDLYLPAGNGPFPLVVFIHGGGWMTGNKGDGDSFPPQLNPRGIAVASINYRLSGEAIFPAQIQDCKAAIRFLRANAAKYKIDPTRIGAMGDSAGAHLALLVGTSANVTLWDTPDMPNPSVSSRVITVVDMAGPTNLLAEDPSFPPSCPPGTAVVSQPGSPAALFLGCPEIGDCPDKVKEVNPITYLTADDPPMLILQGTNDCTVAPDQGRLMAEAMTRLGKSAVYRVMPGVHHVDDPAYASPPIRGLIADYLARTLSGVAFTTGSSADFEFADFAPGQIISIFGTYLGNQSVSASAPFPPTLGGFSVDVKDSAGSTQPAGLVALAPGLLNILLPGGMALGQAQMAVRSGTQTLATETIFIAALAPSVFIEYAAGAYLPNGFADWVDSNNQLQRALLLTQQNGAYQMPPLPYAQSNGSVLLELYGTGIAAGAQPLAYLGDRQVTVEYAGKQGYPGLDQYNIQIPSYFAGIGTLTLAISVDGTPTTPLRVTN